MTGIPKRNVYVFSSSNGAEVAGMFNASPSYGIMCQILSGFFQHGGVSISTFISWINEICYIHGDWALYPSKPDNNRVVGGAALDSTSDDELQPGRYVICTPPPGEDPHPLSFTADY